MNFEDLEDQAKKENIISIVANMSRIDGKLHETELMYLLSLGDSLGIDPETVRDLMKEKDSTLFIPNSEMDRMTILYYLIFLIKIDGNLDKKEEELLQHFALKLGFNHLMISNILDVVRSNLDRKLPPTAIIDEVKKYLN